MLNISKKRLWLANEYDVYRFNRRERGRFLNVWFPEIITYHPIKLKGKEKKKVLCNDKLWTLKKVDADSANHLYNQVYNPVYVALGCDYYLSNKLGKIIYHMCARIKSIDDSSYGIWWFDENIDNLREKRLLMLKYIDSVQELNGEKFFNKAIELGADEETKDYN